MKRSIHILHILQSQKLDPIEKTGHTIRLRCACVWNFLDGTRTPFYMTLSFILKYGLSRPFFFFFPCFWARTHFLFSFLLHSPYFYHNEYEESCQNDKSIFVWMKGMFLRNLQCRSRHKYMWSVRDLDLKSMKRISQGSQTI